MTIDPGLEPAFPTPSEALTDEGSPAAPETRAFTSDEPDRATRPQADFGAPISLERSGVPEPEAGRHPDDDPAPTLTGGVIPPLYADVDETAEPRLPEPRVERPLTRRISQGMPSYSEPDPEIAGVVGRAARGGGGIERHDPDGLPPPDGGTP